MAKATIKPFDPIPTFYYDTTFINNKVEPRVKVKWNQYWPENLFCPNKLAGCGPVAVATVLSYFEYPKTLTLDYDGADKKSISIDWSQIKKHIKSLNQTDPSPSTISTHLNSCSDLEYHRDLYRIIRQIGALSMASYKNENSTSTDLAFILYALRTLLPGKVFKESAYNETDFATLFDMISTDGVALMYGRSSDGGHYWVVDGSWQTGTTVKYYSLSEQVTEPGYILISTTTSTQEYLHINWGWGGNANGYFLVGVFDTTKAKRYDSFMGNSATYNFNTDLNYIHIK